MQRLSLDAPRALRALRPLSMCSRQGRSSILPSLLHRQITFGAHKVYWSSQFRSFSGTACKATDDTAVPSKDNKNPSESSDSFDQTTSIFVRNFPFHTTPDDLVEEFSRFTNVKRARVLRDAQTNRSHGCGFIEFASVEDVDEALKHDGKVVMGGRDIVILPVRKKEKRSFDDARLSRPSSVLFVGNTGPYTTADELEDHFGQFGRVKAVRIPQTFNSTRGGYAFVEFENIDTTRRILENQDARIVDGRTLRLDYGHTQRR